MHANVQMSRNRPKNTCVQGWSDGTAPAVQAVVTGTLKPNSIAISSARIQAARVALQLEADFINAAIGSVQSIARAALTPALGSITGASAYASDCTNTSISVLRGEGNRTPSLSCTRFGLMVAADSAACADDAHAGHMSNDACTPASDTPAIRPLPLPPAVAEAPAPRATVAGVRLEPLAATFSFSAPRRARAAAEVVGAAAADGAEQPGAFGRALSSLLAVAGISAANLTLPGFSGTEHPADPAALVQLWGAQAQAAMRMVRLHIPALLHLSCCRGLSKWLLRQPPAYRSVSVGTGRRLWGS